MSAHNVGGEGVGSRRDSPGEPFNPGGFSLQQRDDEDN